jgi:hypothetical protein
MDLITKIYLYTIQLHIQNINSCGDTRLLCKIHDRGALIAGFFMPRFSKIPLDALVSLRSNQIHAIDKIRLDHLVSHELLHDLGAHLALVVSALDDRHLVTADRHQCGRFAPVQRHLSELLVQLVPGIINQLCQFFFKKMMRTDLSIFPQYEGFCNNDMYLRRFTNRNYQ